MKLSKDTRKEFSNNHRTNYETYNKSNIFEPVDGKDAFDWKQTNKGKPQKPFAPKFDVQSAFERKMKEFWNNKDAKEQRMKHVSDIEESKRESRVGKTDKRLLNAKEKRLLDLNPNLKVEEVKSGLTRVKSFYEKNSLSIKDLNGTAKDRRCNDMNSNIFYDPEKNEENILRRNKSVFIRNNQMKQMELEEENKKKLETQKRRNFSKPKSDFGFLSEAQSDVSKSNNQEPYSARNKMKQNLSSVLDTDKKIIKSPPQVKTESNENVKQILNSEYSHKDTLKKIFNLASSQDSAISSDNFSKKDKQNRQIENFEIVSQNGFEKIEPHEIKYFFSRKGIHIYDFQEKGKYHDGFKSGNISFKIRMSEDPNFGNKMDEINEKISKMGMKLKSKQTNTNKPISDLIPSGVKWNQPNLSSIANGRMEKSKENDKLKRTLASTDKFSNVKIQSDSSYKNPFSLKKTWTTPKTTKSKKL